MSWDSSEAQGALSFSSSYTNKQKIFLQVWQDILYKVKPKMADGTNMIKKMHFKVWLTLGDNKILKCCPINLKFSLIMVNKVYFCIRNYSKERVNYNLRFQ